MSNQPNPWAVPGNQPATPAVAAPTGSPAAPGGSPHMVTLGEEEFVEIPAGEYGFRVDFNDMEEKFGDDGLKGYSISYDFTIMTGEYTGQSFRQWYLTYAYQKRIKGLFAACGKEVKQGEPFDAAGVSGSYVVGTLFYEKGNDGKNYRRVKDLRPA